MAVTELRIAPAGDPMGTPVETWTDEEILDLKLEISLNDLGKNSVKIPRGTWEGSALDARESYYCRVHIPYIEDTDPFWGFWLIGGEFVLVDEDERGGEDVTIGGPGPAWILTRAILPYEQRTELTGVSVQDGTWYWKGKNYGQILSDLINEDAAADFPALDGMEGVGWDNTNDVAGVPWEEFGGIFSQEVGTDYLSIVRELQRAGELDVWITPKLNMRAHVSYGRDLTGNSYGAGVVRFVGSEVTPDENRNIVDNLTRTKDGGKAYTHVLVLGNDRRDEDGHVIEGQPIHEWAIDPDWADGDPVYQGFMTYPTNSHVILERAGQRLIKRSKDRSGRMLRCEVMPGQDEANGLYLPGQPSTDKGDYWIGDTVTFKTGGGDDFDLLNRDLTIAKISMRLDVAADDSSNQAKQRSWRTWVETGDDISPSSSASSSASPGGSTGGGGCKCPVPCDADIPAEDPTLELDLAWDFSVNAKDTTNVYTGADGRIAGAGHTFSTDHGFVGTTYVWISPRILVTAGQVIRFAGKVASNTLSTLTTKSHLIEFFDTVGEVSGFSTVILATSGPSSKGLGVQSSWDDSIVAPAGAVQFRIRVDRQAFYDDMVLQVFDNDGSEGSEGDTPSGVSGVGDPGTANRYARCDHTHAHDLTHSLEDLDNVADELDPADGDVLTWDETAEEWVAAAGGGGGGAGHTIEENGTPLTARTGLNFGSGIVATDDAGNDETDVDLDWAESGDLSTQAFGDTAAAGTSEEVPRADHKHAMPANPVNGGAVMAVLDYGESGDISAEAFGDTAAAGSTGEVADAGHRHAMPANPVTAAIQAAGLSFRGSGSGSVLAVGVIKDCDLIVPFACTITRWDLIANESGSIVLDIWKDSRANHPPTVADTITASAKPTLSSAIQNGSSTLTGWTTSLAAGDVLRINVDSATTVTGFTLLLSVTR